MYSDIMDTIGYVKSCDPEVGAAMEKELIREQNTIELIASENIVSPAVMCAMGSVLTNKYAEGYPGKRYYGGCFAVDEAEDIARERARELFGAEYVNVQPHSGAQANLAAYQALLTPGDRVLGMSLDAGGHLTHGAKFNESGKLYQFECYGVDDDGFLDYEALEAMAKEYQPKLIVAGASAYPRVFDYERLRKIADSVDALLMVDMAHVAGLVAGGVHPSPIPWAHVVTTTTHKTLRGPRGGMILAKEEFGKALNRAIFPGTQGGPLMHIIASKAVCLGEALKPEFKAYAEQVVKNAAVLAEELMAQGAKLVSGGTDNHLILLDTRSFGITGKDLEERLEASGITVNKNSIPNDPEKTTITSGIRIGTPAATTRGMKEDDMRTIATCIVKVAQDYEKNSAEVQETVKALLAKYPLYE